MSRPAITPEERYASLVEELLGTSEATQSGKKGFGSSALWVRGKIFAMLYNDKLVVKLPTSRVDALIASGEGDRFEGGRGRPMKEWVALEPTCEEWLPLAKEAMEFVASKEG